MSRFAGAGARHAVTHGICSKYQLQSDHRAFFHHFAVGDSDGLSTDPAPLEEKTLYRQ
ncbi:hypothetical protein [Devosia enhydra]|uniref:hypothetical protein n=1 Tax=Devosia enhydra TaxID=665118 RepID=UPI0015A5C53A|nr:hypothetical protein [Devosia enhydra]